MDFAKEHWAQIASTNPLERVNTTLVRQGVCFHIKGLADDASPFLMNQKRRLSPRGEF
jgi:hypothetical protein